MDENWRSRGVEIDNHQWRELIEHLEAISEKLPSDYTQFLLAALPAYIALDLPAKEACKRAHHIAYLMTTDDALDD